MWGVQKKDKSKAQTKFEYLRNEGSQYSSHFFILYGKAIFHLWRQRKIGNEPKLKHREMYISSGWRLITCCGLHITLPGNIEKCSDHSHSQRIETSGSAGTFSDHWNWRKAQVKLVNPSLGSSFGTRVSVVYIPAL